MPADLTLQEALGLALERNPELAASSSEVRAAEGALDQAGALPNPVLELSGENLGNARKAEAGDRTTTLQFGQLIELGGKRDARIRMAEAGRSVAALELKAKRIEVRSRVSQRFTDLLASQQREVLAAESMELAQRVADTVGKRVQAGKVSPVEETKAQLSAAAARIELEQARREVAAGRQMLAALWGSPQPHFDRAAGDLEALPALPGLEALAERARRSPEFARWTNEIARRRAGVDGERAKTTPDVTLTAGVSRFSQFDDRAYMVGIAVPLPLFDRNRGGIAEAQGRLDRTLDEQRAAESRLLSELAQAYHRLAAVDAEIAALRATLLPGARSAFDAATRGYELGRFGFLDVLDAQRTLFQARSQHLRALAEYHRGVAELERLSGGPLASIDGSQR